MTRFAALARVLTAAALRSAAPVFAPTYFGLAVASAILFGPNAMRAADVTRAALSEPAASIALWSAWLIVTAPIARAALSVPSTFVLRSMPVPRWQFLLVTGAHLAVVELGWIALWARGQGLLGAVAAGAGAAGAHGLFIARPRRAIEIASVIALALTIGAPARLPLLLAAALLAAPIGVAAAWTRAPERDAGRRRARLPRSGPAALAASHLLAIRRGDGAVFGRALLITALGGVTAPLAARGYDLLASPSSVSALSLGVAAGTLSIGSASIAAAVLRAERASRWLLDASATSGADRVVAASGAVAGCGAILGALHGALTSFGAAAGPSLAIRLMGLGAFLGAAVGVAAAWHARRAELEGPRREGRALARFVAFGGASIAGIGVFGEPAVLLTAAAAVLLASLSSRGAAALPEPLCAHPSASRSRGRS